MENETLTFDNLRAALEDYGQRAEAYYREKLAKDGKNATHTLSESIHYEVIQDGAKFEVCLNLAAYWKYVEWGRRSLKENPAAKPPPVSAILQWVRVKPIVGLDQMPRARQELAATFRIRNAIWKNGIKPTYALRESVRRVNDELNDTINDALAKDLEVRILGVMKETFGGSIL